jgi:hypothetical protein
MKFLGMFLTPLCLDPYDFHAFFFEMHEVRGHISQPFETHFLTLFLLLLLLPDTMYILEHFQVS